MSLTTDPGVASSIPTRSHTFVEIGHEIISTVILLPYAELGAHWLGGRVLDLKPKGCGFEPHRRHCVVSLSKNIIPSLVLVQPRKTRPFITERLLVGRKERKKQTFR